MANCSPDIFFVFCRSINESVLGSECFLEEAVCESVIGKREGREI